MSGRSLQFRITVVATLVVLAVVGLGGLVLVEVFERAQRAEVDAELRADARLIEAVRTDDANIGVLADEQVLVQIIDADGEVINTAGTAGGEALIDPDDRPGVDSYIRTITARGRTGRVLVQRVPERDVVVAIARPFQQATTAADTLRLLLTVGGPLLVALLAALIWWVVGRALRPVEDVRATVDEITARDLSRRLPAVGTGDELARLVATMNDLLGRLETSVARERRFVADAGHELRSPLSGARALLESEQAAVSAALDGAPGAGGPVDGTATDERPVDAAAIADTRARVLATLTRLETIVDDLLSLARADAGAEAARPRSPVDLDELVLGQADRLRRTTTLTIDTSAVSGGQVLGRESDLGRLIDNLTANAQRHTATVIALGVEQADGLVTLTVDDDGPGIAEADRERVFERFTRLDEARSRSAGGAGLGLAIVAAIVDDHDGTVGIDTSPQDGARFTVRLPATG
ncbi:MAG: ATP-binding protein [Actinomycetota bacterium]